MPTTAKEMLDSHPFQECKQCGRLLHESILEHKCIDSSAPRLDNSPPSTAESDYSTIDKRFKTTCEYCQAETPWEYEPDGAHWLCSNEKCGRINTSHKETIRIALEVMDQLKDVLKNLPDTPISQHTVYLSGPMSGYPDYNKPAFDYYAEKYREIGYKVISPPEIISPHEGGTYGEYLRADLKVFLETKIDGIYMLPGWSVSKGANLEKHLAEVLGIPVMDAETGQKETITDEAYRTVYSSRRKAYGGALDNFEHTAGQWSAGLRNKLKEPLTAEDVALMMMLFKISRLFISPNHHDSKVDVVGYDLCYDDVCTERAQREGK